MSVDWSQLREPVTDDDILDLEDYIDSTVETLTAYVERVRFTYQQESWISLELVEITKLVDQAHARLATLRATNCFPRE